ncbi:DsrE family protein [Solwaraspora sp. WMMD1047]|uniref:DsrE family protein n=1 Tax=Solwaraspora sp. WMMD1047 TaxID=3016102 RepID=UPI0024168617|nr:DsrE family protein [Solwaraspora sp. WMMD1047]MDG4831708.1 DsrE family protein [Solwaraspora sp. WMMD1047]
MRSYLFIETRGAHESPDVLNLFELGGTLRESGHEVTIFLTQNAVLALGRSDPLADLIARGVGVWADDYSIAARGLDPDRRPPGVRLGGAADLVRLLMAPDAVPVWH